MGFLLNKLRSDQTRHVQTDEVANANVQTECVEILRFVNECCYMFLTWGKTKIFIPCCKY